MKNFKLNLGVIIFVVTLLIIFSFTVKDNNIKAALQYYYVNPDGSKGEILLGPPECEGPRPKICVAEYNTVTNQPTGNIIYGERP